MIMKKHRYHLFIKFMTNIFNKKAISPFQATPYYSQGPDTVDRCSITFGFKPASLWNIHAPFEVPDEVFMALELTKNALENTAGAVQYSKAFSE
ncbi:Acetyltransferase, GNAT family [Cytobacillus firmus]|uniref:Acetyltransferase, GNAT family n=1 Tax=Cytobacillus firmus TaxID=1399 RepID=A0A800MVC6_CYTFI|nr:Acetyltransferase, GNAT family [Cytobacillus firmus]